MLVLVAKWQGRACTAAHVLGQPADPGTHAKNDAGAEHDCLQAISGRVCHWPQQCEARGLVSLRLRPKEPVSEGSTEVVLLSVRVWPRHFDKLGLSLQSKPDNDVVCCCKDQTTRNKCVVDLRRARAWPSVLVTQKKRSYAGGCPS